MYIWYTLTAFMEDASSVPMLVLYSMKTILVIMTTSVTNLDVRLTHWQPHNTGLVDTFK